MVAATSVHELTDEQARELIDERTWQYLNVDVDEFVRLWRAGYYGDVDDNPDALEIAMLLPMIGVDPWSDDRAA